MHAYEFPGELDPKKSCFVVDCPMVPWYTDSISKAKHLKRKLEKQMKRTGLTVHREMFKMAKTELRILMEKTKSDFYHCKITNSKSLFKVVDTLLHRKSSVLPSYASKQSLADDFAKCFEKGYWFPW